MKNKLVFKIFFYVIIGILIIIIITLLVLFCYPGVRKIPNKDKRNKYSELDYYSNNKFHNIEDTILITGKQNEGGNSIKPNKVIK